MLFITDFVYFHIFIRQKPWENLEEQFWQMPVDLALVSGTGQEKFPFSSSLFSISGRNVWTHHLIQQ